MPEKKITARERGIKTFNAVRNASTNDQFLGAVPEANINSDFQMSFAPMLRYTAHMNEFLSLLVNKIVMQTVEAKTYQNPFSILRGEGYPLGTDIEHSYINPARSREYSIELGDTLLNRVKPDVKVQYFRRNRQDQFPVTVPREILTGGFTRWEQLDDMVAGMIRSLYSGNEIAEMNLVKSVWVDGINNDYIRTITVPNYAEDEAGAKSLIKTVRSLAEKFKFPSANYNNWLAYAQASGIEDQTPAITWVENSDVVLFLTADALASADVDSMAAAFNLNLGDFRTRVIAVDAFSYYNRQGQIFDAPRLIGVLMDRKAIKYRDNLRQSGDFYNPAGLYTNHYLNVWQTYELDMCANIVGLVSA